MNAEELIAMWPGIAGADASAVFGREAWAMPVGYNGNDATLVKDETRERDVIGLEIKFDAERHFLGLAVSEAYPELSKVWTERTKLPDEIVLALVEKECGALFQTLENAARRQVSVVGLADREAAKAENVKAQAFALRDEEGETVCDFSLSMSPALLEEFGRVENLDADHESLRALTRPAQVEYAAFTLTDDEVGNLAVGDCLLLPEIGTEEPQWVTEPDDDDLVHVLSAATTDLSFGDFADDSLPEPPSASTLVLVRKGHAVAEGRLTRLGAQSAFAVEGLKG